MVGIVVALYSEAEKLLTRVENLKEITMADKKAYFCKLNGKDTIIAISGIGKVNAAITTQLLIDKYSPDFILNFGTCGGTNKSVEILKYYVVTKCAQFDFDLRELDGVPLGYIQDYDTVFFPTYTRGLETLEKSVLASSDRFTDNQIDIDNINEMGASIRDMEGGAIAQTCTANNIPLVMIKGISDVVGSGTAQEQFYRNLKTVGEGFPDVVIKAIDAVSKTL
ncbi:MAG: 5'-methylthioadenosine/S-adenosylhomocysteine nucleosidase [Clostridiales bacterium]|nr:5'-methylthioadenosine/S-adenosylhomocysteine nucleosidase [Clostridiales bacterium]